MSNCGCSSSPGNSNMGGCSACNGGGCPLNSCYGENASSFYCKLFEFFGIFKYFLFFIVCLIIVVYFMYSFVIGNNGKSGKNKRGKMVGG